MQVRSATLGLKNVGTLMVVQSLLNIWVLTLLRPNLLTSDSSFLCVFSIGLQMQKKMQLN